MLHRTLLQSLVVLNGAVFFAACSVSGNTVIGDELQENRQRWERVGAPDYEFAYSVLCFCGLARGYEQPFLVVVRADTVHAVLDPETRAPATRVSTGEPMSPAELELIPTIDGLFDVIENAIAQDYHRREVTYHPSLGYPTSIDIEYSPGSAATDGFITYKAEDLRIK